MMISDTPQKYHYSSKIKLLLVEDDPLSRLAIAKKCRDFAEVIEAESFEQAKNLTGFDLAIIDLDLEEPQLGLQLLTPDRANYQVVLTGHEEQEVVVQAYQRGCRDYLTKPFGQHDFEKLLERFWFSNQRKDFIASCQRLGLRVDEAFSAAACSRIPILLTGESGCGKTHLASVIHRHSSSGPFIHLSCSEVPESLLESELFGHRKGAFSGAVADKQGKLELAHGGTLFLDELGTMPISLQKKLLRVIEEKSFYPLGSTKKVRVDFRIISATCDDLEKRCQNKEFRQDLLYRLKGHQYTIAPLRERMEYLPQFIEFLLSKSSRRMVFSEKSIQGMRLYHWPGNFRELKHKVELLESQGIGLVEPQHLLVSGESTSTDQTLRSQVNRFQRELVKNTLERNGGQVRKTLRELKISNATYYKIIRGEVDER